MSTGYKRNLLKSPLSCYLDEIRGYPTDVVETCIATPYGFGASNCQSYQEKVQLGSSIGIIKPQGTLSVVVHDRNSKKIGVIIYQPSHKDLDSLKESFVRMASENKSVHKFSEEMCNNIEEDKQNSAMCEVCETTFPLKYIKSILYFQ